MYTVLLALMAGAAQIGSHAEPARDIQQVAIDTITGRSVAGPARHENREEAPMPSDPQTEIADRIAGRNVTYPNAGEQSMKPADMQAAIARSISGRP